MTPHDAVERFVPMLKALATEIERSASAAKERAGLKSIPDPSQPLSNTSIRV